MCNPTRIDKRLLFTLIFVFSCGLAQAKKTINISAIYENTSLDPVYATKAADGDFLPVIFEGLVTLDNKGKLVLGQAKEWSVSDDGLSHTFKIRDDVYWSDGKPIIADDFYLSVTRLLDPKVNKFSKPAYILSLFEGVRDITSDDSILKKGVRVVDDKTIVFTTIRPIKFLFSVLKHASFFPVPSHVLKERGSDWANPEGNVVSNGPYKYVKSEKGTIFTVKNEYYYNKDKIYFDEAINKVGESNQKTRHLLNIGNIDLIRDYTTGQSNKSERLKNIKLIEVNRKTTTYITINNSKPKFQDARVRKALSLALIRKEMVKRLPNKYAKPVYTFAAESATTNWKRFEPEWSSWDDDKRIKEARNLMEQAGYNENNKLKFELSTNDNNVNLLFVNAVKSYWSAIYVDATVVRKPGKKHFFDLKNGNYDVARAGWVADFDDPSNFLSLLGSKSVKNYAKWNNPKYDELLKSLLKEQNVNKLNQITRSLEQLILDDVPIIPSYKDAKIIAVSNKITGFEDKLNYELLIKHLRMKN